MVDLIYTSAIRPSSVIVSVVCPMFNVEKYVGRLIDNVRVLSTNAKHFEFVFIDDFSDDDSCNVVLRNLTKLESQGLHVSVLRSSENVGSGEIRTTALQYCSGDWIYFYDSDDVPSPDLFNLMYDTSYLEYDLILGSLSTIGVSFEESGQPTTIVKSRPSTKSFSFLSGPGGNMMIRKSTFAKIGGYDPVFSSTRYFGLRVPDDTDLIWRAQLAGAKVVNLPEAVSHYTVPFYPKDIFRKQLVYGIQMELHNVRYKHFAGTKTSLLLPLLKVLALLLTSPVWLFGTGRNKFVGSCARNIGHLITAIYLHLNLISIKPLSPDYAGEGRGQIAT